VESELESALALSEAEVERLSTEHAKGESSLGSSKRELNDIHDRLTAAQSEVTRLAMVESELDSSLAISEAQVERLGAEKANLASSLHDKQARLASAKDENSRLLAELSTGRAAVSESQRLKAENFKLKLVDKKTQVATMELELERSREELRQSYSAREALKGQLEALQVESSQVVAGLEAEISSLESRNRGDPPAKGDASVRQKAVEFFEQCDKNHDGMLSHTEVKKYLKKTPWALPYLTAEGFHWKALWDEYDSNHDGHLDLQEWVVLYTEKLHPLVLQHEAGGGPSHPSTKEISQLQNELNRATAGRAKAEGLLADGTEFVSGLEDEVDKLRRELERERSVSRQNSVSRREDSFSPSRERENEVVAMMQAGEVARLKSELEKHKEREVARHRAALEHATTPLQHGKQKDFNASPHEWSTSVLDAEVLRLQAEVQTQKAHAEAEISRLSTEVDQWKPELQHTRLQLELAEDESLKLKAQVANLQREKEESTRFVQVLKQKSKDEFKSSRANTAESHSLLEDNTRLRAELASALETLEKASNGTKTVGEPWEEEIEEAAEDVSRAGQAMEDIRGQILALHSELATAHANPLATVVQGSLPEEAIIHARPAQPPPAIKQGWMRKKGSGYQAGHASPRGGFGRTNWSKRYFTLTGSRLEYSDSPEGKALFSGELAKAKSLTGGLGISSKQDSSQNPVLWVEFASRTLRIGAPDDVSAEQGAKMVQNWRQALVEHFEYHVLGKRVAHEEPAAEAQTAPTVTMEGDDTVSGEEPTGLDLLLAKNLVERDATARSLQAQLEDLTVGFNDAQAQMMSEIATLQNRLTQAESAAVEADLELSDALEEIASLQRKLERRGKEPGTEGLEPVPFEVEGAKQLIDTSEEQLKLLEASSAVMALQKQLNAEQAARKKLQQQYFQLAAKEAEPDAETRRLQEELIKYKIALEGSQTDFSDASAEAHRLERTSAVSTEEINELKKQLSEAKGTDQPKVLKLQRKLLEATEEVIHLKRSLEEAEKLKQKASQMSTRTTVDVKKLESELAQLKSKPANANQEELEKLRLRLADAEAAIHKAEAERVALRQQMDQPPTSGASEETIILQRKLLEATEELMKIKKETTQEIDSLKKQLKAALSEGSKEEVVNLQRKLLDAADEIMQLQDKLNQHLSLANADHSKGDLEKRLLLAEHDLADAQEKVQALQEQMREADSSALEKTQALQKQLTEAEMKLQAQLTEDKVLASHNCDSLSSLQKELTQAQRDLTELKLALQKSEALHQESRLEVSTFVESQRQGNEMLTATQKMLTEEREALQVKSTQLAELMSTVSTEATLSRMKDAETHRLEALLQSKENEIRRLDAALQDSLVELRQKMASEAADAGKEFQGLFESKVKENAALQEQVRTLKTELDRARELERRVEEESMRNVESMKSSKERMSGLEGQLAADHLENEKLKATVTSLQASLETSQLYSVQSFADAKDMLERKDTLAGEVERLRSQMTFQEGELSKAKHAVNEHEVLRHKLLLAESELSKTRQLLELRESQPLQDEIALLKQKLLLAGEEKTYLAEEAHQRETRAQKESELLSLRLSMASGQGNSEMSDLNDRVRSLTQHCEAQEREVGELQGESRIYKGRCEEMQLAMSRNSQEKDDLMIKAESQLRETILAQGELERLRRELEETRAMLRRYEEQWSGMETDFTGFKNALDRVNISAVEVTGHGSSSFGRSRMMVGTPGGARNALSVSQIMNREAQSRDLQDEFRTNIQDMIDIKRAL